MDDFEKEQTRIRELFDDVPSDDFVDSSDSEESDVCEELNHVSGSETEDEEEQDMSEHCREGVQADDTSIAENRYYLGKDKSTKWVKSLPPRNVRTRKENIVVRLPGVRSVAKSAKLALECFLLFIDDMIIRCITTCTNIFIDSIVGNYSRERDARRTDETEMKCVLGLLILAGVYRSAHQNLSDLWDKTGFGVEVFYATMSLRRFLFLLRCMRFDDIRDRHQRRVLDRLAPLRDVFQLFVSNCEKNYTVSAYTTVDEQLVAFRGRCSFRQYIPSKPAKYGLKILTLCDARSWYALAMEVYVGRQPDGPYSVSNSPTDVVKRLVHAIEGTGRNVTGDNWFSSIPLVKELLQKNITYVGTLRKNKKELPKEFVNVKDREVKSSIFGFREDMTLVSYVPKKARNVILVSSMHHDDKIDQDTGEDRKPEVITTYNRTKTGVDTLDEMCATFTTCRRSKRWPMILFFRLLDIAGINSFVIYRANNSNTTILRRTFLREIGYGLITPTVRKRVNDNHIPRTLRAKAAKLSGTSSKIDSTVQQCLPKAQRCSRCPRNKDIKTKSFCSKCLEVMCVRHLMNICDQCAADKSEGNSDTN